METKTTFMEPLIERIEAYSNTTIELAKLKTIEKTADVSSTFISRLLLVIAISAFAFMLNIAVALWLGEVLGKNYYGFIAVGAFDALLALVLYIMHTYIKSNINNSIIKQLLN
jgi:uncharacterized protein YqhQ